MRRVVLPLFLGLALGCAGVPLLTDVHGPGTLFPSLDEAAVDALAYANVRAHATRRADRMHGGVILSVPGGFTYEHVDVAPPDAPHRLTLVLRSSAAAHFRTYPPSDSFEVDKNNERFSEADLANVDEVDPRRRPAYLLTPSLVVRVYRGEEHGVDRIARVRAPGASLLTARR